MAKSLGIIKANRDKSLKVLKAHIKERKPIAKIVKLEKGSFFIKCPYCSRIIDGYVELKKLSREKFFFANLECKCKATLSVTVTRI